MKVFGKRCQTDMPPPVVLSAARREQSGARKELCSRQHLVRRAKTSVTFGYLVWTTTHDASLNRSRALPQPWGLCSPHCSARAGGCQPGYPDRQLPVSTGLRLPTPLAKPTRCLLLALPPALAPGERTGRERRLNPEVMRSRAWTTLSERVHLTHTHHPWQPEGLFCR